MANPPSASSVRPKPSGSTTARAPSPSASSASRQAPAKPPARVRFGILGRSTITMLVAGLVPVLVFGAVVVTREAGRVRADAESSLRASGERVSLQVDEWLDKGVRALRAAALQPAITSMRTEDHNPVLAAMNKAYPWMYLVHSIGRDGKNVGRSDGKPLIDYSDRQYFKDVMAGKPLSFEVAIGKTSGKPALMAAVPIVANGAIVGALVAAMTIEDISAIIAHWRTGQTGYAFLVDDQAKVVAHPRDEYVRGLIRLADHPLVSAFRADGRPHALGFTQTDGKDALGYVQGNRYGWAVAVQQNTDELFAPVRQIFLVGLAVLLASALVVAIVARVASGMLVRPILDLSAAADRMSTGDLESPITAPRADEIGVLARSLDRLRISMRAAMARLG